MQSLLVNAFASRRLFSPNSCLQRHVTSTLESASTSICLSIPEPSTCEEVGALIGAYSRPPDAIFLDGDLGAGKTTFSRGFIHCKLGVEEEDSDTIRVTSPTYLLSNTYKYHESFCEKNNEINEVRHMDLYRLSGEQESDFDPLELDFVFTKCISLIEWPSRLPPSIKPPSENLLDIKLSILPSTDERQMQLTAPVGSTWNERLKGMVKDGLVEDLLITDTI